MRFNKLKAFTLAEIMIILLTLSILMAAFAPVFTRRYANAGSDDVWTYVVSDDNFDAYYDVISDKFTAQAFVGLTPKDKYQVQSFSSDASNNVLYSKFIIGASDDLKAGGVQKQMQFRYGSGAGQVAGALFAGNENILVGGRYNNIKNVGASANTSFGSDSLTEITGTAAIGNTAVGKSALAKLKFTGNSTAVGAFAGAGDNIGYGNTVLGYYAGYNLTENTSINTAVGVKALSGVSTGYSNVAIGYGAHAGSAGAGYANVSVGTNSLNKFGAGTGNTAVGSNALGQLTSGSYNTAIGHNACFENKKGSYITCIGANSGNAKPDYDVYKGNTVNDEVVLIGSFPVQAGGYADSTAVLEVHNNKTKNPSSMPMPNVGNESVVINGNLIVRGQSYFEVPILRLHNANEDVAKIPKGLVAFKLNSNRNNNSSDLAFSGYDGMRREGKTKSWCDRRCKTHAFHSIRENAICTVVTGGSYACSPSTTNMANNSEGPSKSYDWYSTTNNENTVGMGNCDQDYRNTASMYKDASFGCTITLEQYLRNSADNKVTPGVDKPLAHLVGQSSPCPNLSSDKRLKNVGDKFTAGLEEIKRLNIYNYTFKNDPNKLPQVGVIAQELKLVFPNAVTKDEDGYYRIRWDEMLYAAINSIKTLNSKVEKLAAKIATDRNRVAVLKKDNAELNAKLDKLADELTLLEKKKSK